MKNCAFLTMDSLENFVSYDHLLHGPLKELGWDVESVSWRSGSADWNRFDVVVIRSPWDYQEDPDLFLEVLEKIDASSARLENDIELVRWNISKTYLKDLEERGLEIVPTLWPSSFQADRLSGWFGEFGTDEIVIKPVVGASADHTWRLRKSDGADALQNLEDVFRNRPFLVQPFMSRIVDEGEFSLFFFGDSYSHTILKTPKPEDFRVQEEHGGILQKAEPEEELLSEARDMMEIIRPDPLYARLDYVRTDAGTFALMELELIEPSLYFNMDPQSPQRFAKVFDSRMAEKLVSE